MSGGVSLSPVSYALHRPLRGLPVHLVLIWPLIFARLMLLKLWVRRHYGRGVPYRYRLDWWGRVTLYWLPTDLCWAASAPAPLMAAPENPFTFACMVASRALARACAPLAASYLPSPPPGLPARPAPPLAAVRGFDSS